MSSPSIVFAQFCSTLTNRLLSEKIAVLHEKHEQTLGRYRSRYSEKWLLAFPFSLFLIKSSS